MDVDPDEVTRRHVKESGSFENRAGNRGNVLTHVALILTTTLSLLRSSVL